MPAPASRWFTCALGSASSVAVIGVISILSDSLLLFPALGASAFLMFHAPRSALACPRNALLGHALGAAIGMLAAVLCGVDGDGSWIASELPWRAVLAAAIALGVTGGAMTGAELAHPPAGATTLIMATGLMSGLRDFLAIVAGVAALTLIGRFTYGFGDHLYPLWAPHDEARPSTRS